MTKIYVLGIDEMVLPLTQRLVREGALPNLAALMERGAVTQAVPSFPGWTPTNWATISTGANTGTHGVFTWFVDMPEAEPLSSFHSHAVAADTIWEAAERAGLKSAVFHYPASMPAKVKQGFVVDGFAAPQHGSSPYEIAPSRGYTTLPDLPISDEIELEPATDWKNLPTSNLPALWASLQVKPKEKTLLRLTEPADRSRPEHTDGQPAEGLTWALLVYASRGRAYDRVMVCTSKDGNSAVADLGVGEWSAWTFQEMPVGGVPRRCTMRFKLIELSEDASRLRLYRSQVMPVEGFTHPPELAAELVERFGPYQEHVSQHGNLCRICDFQTVLEESEYHLQWIVKAGRYLLRERGADLFMCHVHFVDDIQLHHHGLVDPEGPRYDPDTAPFHWDRIRRAYQIVDRAVGFLLDDMDEDTYLFVVSDHGSLPLWYQIHVDRFLWEHGFLVLKDNDEPPNMHDTNWADQVDWERTKAYVRGGFFFGPEIYVNAEGEERRRIQEEVIHALLRWKHEETGESPVAQALKKEDAVHLGYWGERRGDIVVVTNGHYIMGRGKAPASITPARGMLSAHPAFQQLTFQTDLSSHMAIVIAAGPDIKEGYRRPVDKLGRLHLRDLAPTWCHILGIEPPAQCEGSVAYDLFVNHEGYREHRPPAAPRLWTDADAMAFNLLRQHASALRNYSWEED